MEMYDEYNKCKVCEEELPSSNIKYQYSHDGGLYNDAYRKVNTATAKKVGNHFYCNKCYSKLGGAIVSDIKIAGRDYIDNEIKKARQDILNRYQAKIDKLDQLEKYIMEATSGMDDKSTLKDLSVEELEKLDANLYLYNPNYQEIGIGFPSFKGCNEIPELIRLKK